MDLIDRKAAINAVHEEFDDCLVWDECGQYTADKVERILDCVPSVQPESNCLGCKHAGMWEDEFEYGYPSPCTGCKRRANDNYEQ